MADMVRNNRKRSFKNVGIAAYEGAEMKKQYPNCEVCGKESAISFSWFQDRGASWSEPGGKWLLAGYCTSGREDYYVLFGRFFESEAETANWLAHLSGKTWFDWRDFTKTMRRFSNGLNGICERQVPSEPGRLACATPENGDTSGKG